MAKLDPIISKETPPLFWLDGFEGINQHDDRRAIGDQECFWMENFAPLGKGNARTMYDAATPIYTAAHTIVYDFPFNIGSVFYKALFLADGSAVAVRLSDGVAVSIGAASTFAITPTLPACAQWGASGIVIVTATGYYAWDGTLYSPGDFSPAWLSGFTNLSTTGDTHTNTTVDSVASVTGVVVGMTITDTLYASIPAGTLVDAVTSGPNVITLSQAATASNSPTPLKIGWAMPSGLVGSAVEIYQSRVWVFNGPHFSFSAPGNGADFSTADGGGTVTSSDGFLKTKFVNAKQSNGFLYVFGDGSINVISNVQTSGSPPTTTFNNQNVDPQTGLGWRDALVPFGRALCFANPTGVYALFGGAAQKISDKIDHLFQHLDASTVTPTMFAGTIFNVLCIGMVMNTFDHTTETQRTLMVLWNGSKWFVGSQSYTTKFASTVESDAHPKGWGNDGTRVYAMFEVTSDTLTKKIVTKLWPGRSQLIQKTTQDIYVETADESGTGVVLTGYLDSDTNAPIAFSITSVLGWLNNTGGVINFVNNANQLLQFLSSPPGIQGTSANQAGNRLGLTLESTSPDFDLIGLGMTYNENRFFGR